MGNINDAHNLWALVAYIDTDRGLNRIERHVGLLNCQSTIIPDGFLHTKPV